MKIGLRHFRDAKMYTKQKRLKSEDQMTNLGERNFTQNITLNLCQLNDKEMDVHVPFLIFSENKNDGRYTDHLVTAGCSDQVVHVSTESGDQVSSLQFSSVREIGTSLYTARNKILIMFASYFPRGYCD